MTTLPTLPSVKRAKRSKGAIERWGGSIRSATPNSSDCAISSSERRNLALSGQLLAQPAAQLGALEQREMTRARHDVQLAARADVAGESLGIVGAAHPVAGAGERDGRRVDDVQRGE